MSLCLNPLVLYSFPHSVSHLVTITLINSNIIVFGVCKNNLYLIFFHFSQSSQSFKSLITFLLILICFCSGIGHQQLFREGRKTILRTGKDFKCVGVASLQVNLYLTHNWLTYVTFKMSRNWYPIVCYSYNHTYMQVVLHKLYHASPKLFKETDKQGL